MSLYITTPLFYVNDLPHIGSAYPTIVCDFIAGHMRQRRIDVAFLTGTDEHGQKIEEAAKQNNKNPQEHCDYITGEFQKLWNLLEIKNDFFVRTSSNEHKEFVTKFFDKVFESGDIYQGEYQGLYCVSCEDFWLAKDLENSELCPLHKKPVTNYSQKNYFFALSKYETRLKQYIKDHPNFISPESRQNEVLSFIEEGLKDFPISRCGLNWGIPIPQDTEGQKIYVWFDALLGYISGLKDKESQYWQASSILHVIGKDILRFHAIYWPAILMSAGMPLPKMVFGHGFLTKDGMKMGKTLGNIINPIDLVNDFGPEAVKFYFLREIIFGRDGDFTQAGFVSRLNIDLANNLGNLLSRSLSLVKKYHNNRIPEIDIDPRMSDALNILSKNFFAYLDKLETHSALDLLFKTLDLANMIINEIEPWRVLKNPESSTESTKQANISLITALETCLHAAFYLYPAMPQLAKKILLNLNIDSDFYFNQIPQSLSGHQINEEFQMIFQRIDDK